MINHKFFYFEYNSNGDLYMLNAKYEQSYISAFAKIFVVLKEEYDLFVKNGEEENYEIEIKKINDDEIDKYLSICFQKQNGSLTVVMDKNINDKIKSKVIKDISLALNKELLATYNCKNLKDYKVYHFCYIDDEVAENNKKILEKLNINKEIENLKL